MTDFYAELSLDRNKSLEEINTDLSRLESTWKRREITAPEKATKMLALIIDARTVFSTEQSRNEYDKSLAQPPKAHSGSGVSEQYNKAWDDTISFCENKQWDLAKVSLEKALSLMDNVDLEDEEICIVYIVATDVHMRNGLYEQAIDFSNKAIVSLPESLNGYWSKELALRSYIENMKKKNLDVSQYVTAYRTTCQIIAKKAREQADKDNAAKALSFLAAAYINYPPKNYDAAEQSALEALSLCPSLKLAQEVIQCVNQPRQVTLHELRQYDQEVSPYEEAIKELVHEIISSKLKPESEHGWLLVQKNYFGNYNPNKDGFDEEITTTFSYYLDKTGAFVEKRTEEDEQYESGGGLVLRNNKEYQELCKLSDLMKEMDFDGYISYSSGSSWVEKGTSMQYLEYQAPSCIRNNGTLHITQKARKKGQTLYLKLKSIVDEASAFIEKCERINAAYNTELEALQKKIVEKYAIQEERLLQEQNAKIEDAKRNDSQRQTIQSQVSAMKKELSSLSFFALKRKKELQASIIKFEKQLDQLPTVESVKSIYEKKINDLLLQKNSELRRLEQDLRNKYPLPKQ